MSSNPLYGEIYDNHGCSWIFGRRTVGRVASSSTGPLSGSGGRRSGPRLSAGDKARLSGVVSGSPQAFIKVISRTHTATSVANTLNYISRDGDLDLETRDGPITDKDDLANMRDDWMMHAKSYDHDGNSGRASLSTHLTLSMPEGTDRARFKQAVRDFVKEEFDPRHDYAMTFHDDTDHPHAHLVVLTRDDDGKVLETGRLNLDRWRERFTEKLRSRGIEADASPRQARGHFSKHPQSWERHAERRGAVIRNRVHERREVNEKINRREKPERDWDKIMAERREAICASYRAASAELSRSADPEDRKLGGRLSAFERAMPPSQTRHQKAAMQEARRQYSMIMGNIAAEQQKSQAQQRQAEAARPGRSREPER